jgi:hypothetical protein
MGIQELIFFVEIFDTYSRRTMILSFNYIEIAFLQSTNVGISIRHVKTQSLIIHSQTHKLQKLSKSVFRCNVHRDRKGRAELLFLLQFYWRPWSIGKDMFQRYDSRRAHQ